MDGKIIARVVSGLVLIAAIAAIGFFAFNAGVAKGSPVMIQAPSGETSPAPIPYPYPYYGYPVHHGFGFGWGLGLFGLLIPLFFLFVALRAFRFMLWGGHRGHMMHGHGPWSMGGQEGVPPMFAEWHKRLHEEQPGKE